MQRKIFYGRYGIVMKRLLFVCSFLVFLCFGVTYVQSQEYKSYYGRCFTPYGDLRVLMVFVRFENDNLKNEQADNKDWPANSPIPVWADDTYLYPDKSYFDRQSYDNTGISDYFYRMSCGKFRFYGDYVSVSIKLPAKMKYNGWNEINKIVLDSLNAKYEYRLNEFADKYDNRGEAPDNRHVQTEQKDSVIDYLIINYRYFADEKTDMYPKMYKWEGSTGGYAAGIDYVFSNGLKVLSKQSFTLCAGVRQSKIFIHEIGHALFTDPHYGGANNVNAPYLHVTKMGGMMTTGVNEVYYGANAWERWYIGWIDSCVTDVKQSGEYVLEDYFSTSQAIRIKLPEDNYLWLENHQHKTLFDGRFDNPEGTYLCQQCCPLPASPKGLVAYVEKINGVRETDRFVSNMAKGSAIKLLHRAGNYDLLLDSVENNDWIWCDNPNAHFSIYQENPYSGYNKASNVYIKTEETDYNSSLAYSTSVNTGNKKYMFNIIYLDGNLVYGTFATDAAFQTGDSIGICTNPPIVTLQKFDYKNQRLEPIRLCGVSVKVLHTDDKGNMRLKIDLDNYDFNNKIRMCGDVIFPPAKVNINANLTIDKSGTANRTNNDVGKKIDDFINPSVVTLDKDTYLRINSGSEVSVKNGSTLVLESGSTLEIMPGAILTVNKSSSVVVKDNARIIIQENGLLELKSKSTYSISDKAELKTADAESLKINKKAIKREL